MAKITVCDLCNKEIKYNHTDLPYIFPYFYGCIDPPPKNKDNSLKPVPDSEFYICQNCLNKIRRLING